MKSEIESVRDYAVTESDVGDVALSQLEIVESEAFHHEKDCRRNGDESGDCVLSFIDHFESGLFGCSGAVVIVFTSLSEWSEPLCQSSYTK